MAQRRPEILSDRQNLHACPDQIVHGFEHLAVGFAEADHQAALGRQPPASYVSERPQTHFVSGARAHLRRQPPHRLDVVPENVRTRVGNQVDQLLARVEVGNQQLDRRIGIQFPHRAHGLGPQGGSAVGQVIAVHRRDHAVFQSHKRYGTGELPRLVRIGR